MPMHETPLLDKQPLQYFLNHSSMDVYFKQSKDDFVVTEVPLYEFSGEGEHLIVKLRKKDLATWDALHILSDFVGCKSRDIGYAGLKDKNAMTIQYLSMPKKFEEKLKTFEHKNIKILETTYHNNKIRIGHLKGNKFFIRLKHVSPVNARKIEEVLGKIVTHGIPNYFGFQRFGIEGDNYIKGREIAQGKRKERNKKLNKMFISAYQSHLFNHWLSKRIEISKLIESFEAKQIAQQLGLEPELVKQLKAQTHPFKVLPGDVMGHYPYGKIFYAEDIDSEAEKFTLFDRVPTGLLAGKKPKIAQDVARTIEESFDEVIKVADGSRRYAWIFPTEMESQYKEEQNHMELNFFLPKGSYATVLIEQIIH
ncbi:MAG: tRNA pseudouridine(13) synthase TruD [Campylobacterota bacterium]|nr:tRNA pseudouridine(13) synthase TruD [Campylobacterota bacterium]